MWWPLVPVALAVGAAAALLLPWWGPATGPVLLGDGPLRALAPDVWTGTEVAGPRAAVVAAFTAVAVLAVVAQGARRRGLLPRAFPTALAAAAGAAAAACGCAVPFGWTVSSAPGVWVTAGVGLAAVGTALVRASPRRAAGAVAAALLAAGLTAVVPGGSPPPDRVAAGPFVRVAAIGGWPLRSGAPGLAGPLDDARPVVVDGAPGLVTSAGIEVADTAGRARVVARADRGAPPALGVAGGRLVYWTSADALVVTALKADDALNVLVRNVVAASPLGADGSVWLRSQVDPPEVVRRLDLAAYDGSQDLSAVYLPIVTVQNPRDEPTPLDVRGVLPVPGGALRLADLDGTRQLQLPDGDALGHRRDPGGRGGRPAVRHRCCRHGEKRPAGARGRRDRGLVPRTGPRR